MSSPDEITALEWRCQGEESWHSGWRDDVEFHSCPYCGAPVSWYLPDGEEVQ